MKLHEIQICEGGGAQIIVLHEKAGTRQFPIYIGIHEMSALDHAVHGQTTQRPLTHDLILNVIDGMDGRLERVIVDDLRNETFYGKLAVRTPGGDEVLVDSRPSDAMVVAARRRVPVYVAEHVLDTVDQHQSEND